MWYMVFGLCAIQWYFVYQMYIYIFWYLVYNRFSINSVAPQSMLVLVNCMTQSRPASALLVTSVLHGSPSLSSHNRKPAEGRRHTWVWLDGGHQKSDLIIKKSQKHMWDWLEANQGQISFSSVGNTLTKNRDLPFPVQAACHHCANSISRARAGARSSHRAASM